MTRTIRALLIAVAATFSFQEFALSRGQSKLDIQVQELVQDISGDAGPNRHALVQQIPEVILSDNPTTISAQTITLLSALLQDEDDFVRFWVAVALGNIGAPAKPAVPALERALQDAESRYANSVPPSLYSADAINDALAKIAGKP